MNVTYLAKRLNHVRSLGHRSRTEGFSLIEVLVALVVVALGLFGLTALQAKLQLSEVDSYQRAQALLLVQDMAERIATNRKNAAAYVTATGTSLGTGDTQATDCSTITGPTIQKIDFCQWSNTLKGVAEKDGTTLTGAMVGAQGCVEAIGNDSYLISVVWQGLTPLSAPSVGITCGAGEYDGAAGSPCQKDLCRRAVSTIVRIGTMD